jgi:hypothetical protein
MSQKIQLFTQDPQAGNPYRGWVDVEVDLGNERNVLPHLIWVAIAMVGLLIVGIIAFPAKAAMVTLVAVGLVALPWGIYCTSRKVSRILIVLVLIEAAAASTVVAEAQRDLWALIRFPVEFLFCLPIFLSVWRSKLLRQGGFRDFKIYLFCALASATYSLVPEITFVRGFAAILPFVVLCAIAEEVHCGDDARRVMGVLLAGCGIVVAINFLALVLVPASSSWHSDPDTGMLRFNGIFTEPNEIGSLAMATLGAGFGF